VTLFGESHGPAIGAVLDGLCPGLPVDEENIRRMLRLRQPGGAISTARKEADVFEIISGAVNGIATGTPLTVLIRNNDVKSGIQDTAVCMQRGIIRIFDTNKETIKELEGYVWDSKQSEDKPVKVNDHLMDAARYFVRTKRLAKPVNKYVSVFGG
jgi:hypothetical protein